jgi:hypothetical protein
MHREHHTYLKARQIPECPYVSECGGKKNESEKCQNGRAFGSLCE